MISKVFAILFPILLLGIAQAPSIFHTPVTYLILCNVILAISLVTGSVVLALTLFKFVQARRKLNSLSGSGVGSRSRATRSTTGNEAMGATDAADARRRKDDRWMVIRFTIAFVFLGLFELCTILFQYVGLISYVSTATPILDISTSSQIMSIVLFIPGVTSSLIAFLIWGTTATFRVEILALLCCSGVWRRASRLGNKEDGRGTIPRYFERLPTRNGKNDRINVTTELTVINVGKMEAMVKVKEWESVWN